MTPTDPNLDAIIDGDVLVDLDRLARILNAPSADAVRQRINRGTLPLHPVRTAGRGTPPQVAAVEVYRFLGIQQPHPVSA